MEVCRLCQKLRPLTAEEATDQGGWPRLAKHCRSLSELQTSSTTCSLCHLMLSRIDLSRADGLPSWIEGHLRGASVFVMLDRSFGRDQATMLSPRLCFTDPDEWGLSPPSQIETMGKDSGKYIYSTDWRHYLLCSLCIVDNDNEPYMRRALWDLDRSQKLHERLKFAYTELQNCLSNHDDCRSASSSLPDDPPPLPTRVIDVWYPSKNDNAQARLIHSNGSKAHYTALSYCWGGWKTEDSTIEELKQGVQPSRLAKTYKDAIYVTRSMGIKYLWIDALCIMQNDPAEVEVEMASMANIYHNAQVSISASASTSLHGGCIYPLEPPLPITFSADYKFLFKNLLHGLKSRFRQSGGCNPPKVTTKQKAYVRSRPRYGEHVLRSPLTTRGWTLQEDLIPLRRLYCAADQIYWQCKETITTEDGAVDRQRDMANNESEHNEEVYDDWGAFPYVGYYTEYLKGATHRLCRGLSRRGTRNEVDLELWHQVINHFTARTLKYPGDRLRAVAGLINDNSCDDTDNLAGLWREDLRFGLCWRAHPSSRDLNLPSLGIPSWSWISFNGRVQYEDHRTTNNSRARIWQFFDVVDAAMKWSGEALTSQLEEATLELNAFLQPLSVEVREPGHAVHIIRASGIDDANFRATVSSCTGESVRFCGRFTWDPESNGDAELDRMLDEDTSVIYAMHLSSYCGDRWNEIDSQIGPQDVTFLLVEPTGRMKDEYRRIGLGKVSPKHGLFEGVSKRRITLV